MKPAIFLDVALSPALRLLPPDMGGPAGAAMVLAVCLQESGLKNRVQVGGPANGYPQFERGGVRGVLMHPASAPAATFVCSSLDYLPVTEAVYRAIEHNDVLACAFARLLLWTLPAALPNADNPDLGWDQYVAAWRPGTPRRETWNAYFEQAWLAVADATNPESSDPHLTETKTQMIKPTVGRVVLFHPGTDFVGACDVGQPLPALIAKVFNDTTINIGGFDANGRPFARTSVLLVQDEELPNPDEQYAYWMPYQKQVAAGEAAPVRHATSEAGEATEGSS